MQQADSLEFFAGDAVRRLNIIRRSTLPCWEPKPAAAYPAYMARANGREAMRAGVISAPEGSTLTLKVSASQHLQSAEDAQGHPLRVEGSNVIIPNILLEREPREIELDWMDSDGLAASRPVKIQLEPIEDKQPSIYLRGGENDRYVLEDTSIELEVEAADDFGLREMGVEWQGEKSFYDGNEDENGASAPKPAGARQTGARPPRGESAGGRTAHADRAERNIPVPGQGAEAISPARRHPRVYAGLQTGRQTRLFGTHDYFRPFQVRARPDDSQ